MGHSGRSVEQLCTVRSLLSYCTVASGDIQDQMFDWFEERPEVGFTA
jgi:hypothetical protein